MKIRAILRDFIKWQTKKELLKEPLTIDYELAETYLEETDKQLILYGVSQRSELFVAMFDKMTDDDIQECTNGFAKRVFNRLSNQ